MEHKGKRRAGEIATVPFSKLMSADVSQSRCFGASIVFRSGHEAMSRHRKYIGSLKLICSDYGMAVLPLHLIMHGDLR